MFAVFGKLRQSQRDVGAVTWASMSAFKPPFVNPEPVQRNPVVVRDGVQVLTLDWSALLDRERERGVPRFRVLV